MVEFLEKVNALFPLSEKDVQEEFKSFNMSGMDFEVSRYYADGLGTVSHMHSSGMGGAMSMDTIVICPLKKDSMLVSYDRIFAMGNDTLIYERYEGNKLVEHTEEKGPVSESGRIDEITFSKLDEYLKDAFEKPCCDESEKTKEIQDYALWLLDSGGIATENFIKNIGREKTKEFFTNVLFSTKIG